MKMTDLFEDIKDGVCLLALLEVLSGETLVILLCTSYAVFFDADRSF